MNIAIVCDPPDAVLVHKPTWVADGFRAAGHSVRLVHDLAGVRAADAECDLVLFDHKASGLNRAALAELARGRKVAGTGYPRAGGVPSPQRGSATKFRSGVAESSPLADAADGTSTRCAGAPVPATIWLQWWRDLIAVDPAKPLVEQDYIRSFGAVMRGMDVVFVKERSFIDEYRALGINAYWLDQACPANMPACEHRERPEWDVLVLGSPGYAQRRADARALADAGFRVLWAGMAASDPVPPGIEWHPWVHPLKLPELVSRCGVVLGVDWRSDLPGYTSDRTYLVCGMGAYYVARCHHLPLPPHPQAGTRGRGEGGRKQNSPASSAPQSDLAAWVYDNVDDLIEIVRVAVADVSERRRRAEQSRRLAMESHTYAHRAAEIVQLLARNGRYSAFRETALPRDGPQ